MKFDYCRKNKASGSSSNLRVKQYALPRVFTFNLYFYHFKESFDINNVPPPLSSKSEI